MLSRGYPTLGAYLSLLPATFLAGHLIIEQTLWTWDTGPQMVGWVLAHLWAPLLIPTLLASLTWVVVTLVVRPIMKKTIRRSNALIAAIILGCIGVGWIPYGFWVELFARKIAAGPHATEVFVHMAGLGHIPSARALLDAGVPINESNKSGYRAIEVAEAAKQAQMRSYLASRGGTDKRW